jgi:Tol biopolymer transport system component
MKSRQTPSCFRTVSCCISVAKNSKFTLSSYSLQDRRATEIVGIQSTTPINAAFSPDGRWIAYQSGDSGRDNLFVQPFPPTGATFQISRNEDAHHPAWSRDGKELFYIPAQINSLSGQSRPSRLSRSAIQS